MDIKKLRRVRGGGIKRKNKLSSIISAAKKKIKNAVFARTAITSALKSARAAVKKAGGKNNISIPRILPIPSKFGGYLPFLIPFFSGLSAVGALAGGAAGIAKTINELKAAQRNLAESKRHNKTMEAIALGKGLYLKPYKEGMSLYLKPLYQQGMGLVLRSYVGDGLRKKKNHRFT